MGTVNVAGANVISWKAKMKLIPEDSVTVALIAYKNVVRNWRNTLSAMLITPNMLAITNITSLTLLWNL